TEADACLGTGQGPRRRDRGVRPGRDGRGTGPHLLGGTAGRVTGVDPGSAQPPRRGAAGGRPVSVLAWQSWLYPDAAAQDPVARFVRTLERHARPSHDVLDLGAGAGLLNTYALKGRVRQLVGVDLDPRVVDNPLLDRGVVGDLAALPFADDSFDLAFSI